MQRLFGLAVCALIAVSSVARAQGVQTGTITGIVQSSDGLSLPGVTVTATSPALQGQRTAVTDVNGVYVISVFVPPAFTNLNVFCEYCSMPKNPGDAPVVDANRIPIPVFTPGVTRVQNWLATKGAVININMTSLYLQDYWVIVPRLSVELGTRFEAVRSNANGRHRHGGHDEDRPAPRPRTT